MIGSDLNGAIFYPQVFNQHILSFWIAKGGDVFLLFLFLLESGRIFSGGLFLLEERSGFLGDLW